MQLRTLLNPLLITSIDMQQFNFDVDYLLDRVGLEFLIPFVAAGVIIVDISSVLGPACIVKIAWTDSYNYFYGAKEFEELMI